MRNKFIVCICLLICCCLLFTCFYSEVKMYYECYSNLNDSYCVEIKNTDFAEIFFDPKSKIVEIYGIDGFDYLTIDEAKKNSDVLLSFEAIDKKVFDGEIIDELIDLLRQCVYIPINREEAFLLNIKLKSDMIVTIVSLSSYWFSKENPYYSTELVDELISKGYGIIYGEIYQYDNKLYLIADFADETCYSEQYKGQIIKMNETKRCVYEIKESDISNQLLNQKFRVDKKQAYMAVE